MSDNSGGDALWWLAGGSRRRQGEPPPPSIDQTSEDRPVQPTTGRGSGPDPFVVKTVLRGRRNSHDRLMTPPIHQRGRRAAVAAAAVLALIALGIVLVSPVLTRLVVLERTPLSRLLGTTAPAELDFQVPEPVGLVGDTDDLQVLTALLVTKEAVRTSLGRPANLPGDSPRFDFDYGYKGPTVRVLSNGSVEVVLAKSEFRHKSLAGSLWTKLADRDEDSGPYVSYLTAPDPEVLRVVESIYSGLGSQ